MTARSAAAPVLILCAAIAGIVAGVRLVLQVPGIPYNVQELFLNRADTPALVFFALTVLWIGAGPMLLAHAASSGRRPFVVLPAGLIVVSLVSKMLVSRSVTYESLDDILGSVNLFGLVANQHAWGSWWSRLFQSLGPDVVDFLERRVRYTALYSIPLLALTLTLFPIARSARSRRTARSDWLMLAVTAAVWFWLARTIVVTWAATDNLTELLAANSPLGFGGEWYLMGIPLVMGISVAVLIRAAAGWMSWPLAFGATAAMLPLGWVLLNLGLDSRVQKYGAVFSGAQFLLGPDRTHLLSQPMLAARWSVVQLAGIAVIFVGAWAAHRITCDLRTSISSRSTRVADAAS